ncbi:MAG: hypothetical protein ACI8RD_013807 [Bacillariaceae sp.]|jgi:hypothetical protein
MRKIFQVTLMMKHMAKNKQKEVNKIMLDRLGILYTSSFCSDKATYFLLFFFRQRRGPPIVSLFVDWSVDWYFLSVIV